MDYRIASNKIELHPLVKSLIALILCAGVALLGAMKGIAVLYITLSIPFILLYFVFFFRNPKIGVYTILGLGFSLPILGRYSGIPIPWGLGVDILLVLTYVVLLLKHWKYLDFRLAANSVVLLMSIWMGYIILQIANPEAQSIEAWFYTMRGMGLYQFLIIPLGFVLLNSKKDWDNFFNLWLAFGILAILWALKQHFFGVSTREQRWLDNGAATTHVLFGQLRIFSYYFDAGSFGASMGQLCIMCLILFLGPFKRRKKILYLVVGIFAFYALMLSGTRGALAVPAIGGILYLIMIKNIRLIIAGALILTFGFVFLKHTSILQSNGSVRRLRTALNPEDASLHVRLVNRERLTEYLKDKPFGGGLGSSGIWGKKFSPNTWLANFPPDGLYTRIRAETGLVGRIFYVCMWVYILIAGLRIMWRLENPQYRFIAMAFLAGYAGILVANYGNEVMTQFPLNLMTFVGITFVFSMKYWNDKGEVELPNGPTPVNGAYQMASQWKEKKKDKTSFDA